MARKKKPAKATVKATRVFDGDNLRATVEDIEECMDAVNDANADLKAVKKKARAQGYDLVALGTAIKEHRAKDANRLKERRALTELYRQALGLTPMEEIMQAGGGDAGGKSRRKPAKNGTGEGVALQ